MEIVAPDVRNLETKFHSNGCKFQTHFIGLQKNIFLYSETFLCLLLKG